jgi:hypothetical protein
MLSRQSSLKLVLATTASIASFMVAGELPSNAATLANSEALLRIDEFNILPKNPDADSNRDAIAFTGNDDSIADANGDGTLAFVIDESNQSNTFLDLDFNSNASGEGTDFFALGVSSSLVNSTFVVDSNEILSFDFTVSLALESIVDNVLDGSVKNFSSVSFALFDDLNDTFLGEFRAIGNLDTNLANGIDNDTIFATSNLNFNIISFDDEQLFGGNQELASIDLTGNIQQTFTNPTQVRLEARTFNRSCTQAPQTEDPCIKTTVPESNLVIGLILNCLGMGLFFERRKQRAYTKFSRTS